MDISEEVLMGIAAIAVALIGFSGVVMALRRPGSGQWSSAELLQLHALIDPSIVTLFSAFAPVAAGLLTDNDEIIWRTANAVCFLGHGIGFTGWLRNASATTLSPSHKFGIAATVLAIVLLLGSAVGLIAWMQFTFLFGLLLGIGVSIHNFYLLFFPEIDVTDG